MNIQGKVALITGGGTGLGRVIAQQLAREGMQIAIHYSHSEQEARDTVREVQELGAQALVVQADLNGPTLVANCKRLIEEVANHFGRLDLLINNAGTTRGVPFSDLDALTEADWNKVLNVNTKAPFFTAQAAAPIMRRNGGGQIINTASIAGLGTTASSIAYAVSKAGMIHLTRCLAVALAPTIRVNAVAPGVLPTRWNANFTAERLQQITQQTPLQKVTDLEDTAAVYVMLARNESITGEIITVDAGVTL
jgi:3-oxoacyl-[acyl-carrier protein] reductase